MALHKLTERTWLTADRSRAVEDGSPEAAFLLGAAGAEIEMAEAKRLGLVGERRAEARPEPEAKAVQPEQVQNKAVQPDANKGRR